MLRKLFKKSAGKQQQAEKKKQAQPKVTQERRTPSGVPVVPRNILILEDEGQLSGLLQEYLEEHKFRVTCVGSGVDGLKHVMNRDFDVIVCDMLMPTLPGDMFYVAVQKVKPHLCRRFIFMTGHRGDKKIDDFIRSVHGVMLWKPLEPQDLLRAIHSVIRKN